MPPYPPVIRGHFDSIKWLANPNRSGGYFDSHELEVVKNLEQNSVIKGMPGSAGQVEGLVRCVDKIEDANLLQQGEILVPTQTHIGWTPYFPCLAAVITVYSAEPPKKELLRSLLARDEVVATPHLGANTVEAQRDVAVQVVQQVIEALRGENFRNVVNLPFPDGVDYRSLAPYMNLAEKIGSLSMQLIRGRISRVEVEFRGEEVESSEKPLTVALLKGLLTPILSEDVNFVNAPRLAGERGIQVARRRHPAAEGYSNIILCRAVSTKETRLVGGALGSDMLAREHTWGG